MIILSADPGTLLLGYAALRFDGRTCMYVEAGTLTAPKSWPRPKRLMTFARELDDLFDEYKPGAVAIEDGVFRTYANSALALGEARGLVISSAARHGLAVEAFPPATVKATVAHGGASKEEVAVAVQRILGLRRAPAADAADALAIGLTLAAQLRVRGTRAA